jgi:sugar fermentation stimulation protein A
MRFQTPLVPARLIRRYKRFLADCVLDATGEEITAHCANPGSMMGLATPGQRVWMEPNDDPKRKLKFGWRLVDHENGHFIGVDTAVPNRVLKVALQAREIAPLSHYTSVQAEVPYGDRSRIDFLLSANGQPDAWVEVKSVTLCRTPGLAEFPDSVTARGAKHLGDLAELAASGQRAVLLFLVQRTDCSAVAIARDIDPAYGTAFDAAKAAGVETIAISCTISTEYIEIGESLAVHS